MPHLTLTGCGRRMKDYLGEMFPLAGVLASSCLLALACNVMLGRIHRLRPSLYSPAVVIGAGSLFLMLLILRLMDELKDRDLDRELFPHRPLASGRVFPSDIRLSLGAAAALFFALNLASPRALGTAVLAFAYSFLMFRFFFIPRILRRNLLLALATHNPIVPILILHLVNLFAVGHLYGLRSLAVRPVLLLVAMYWSALFAWEISRKIRAPEEEDAYVTYSRVLGPAGAVALAAGAQTIALVIGLHFYRALSLSAALPVILLAGYGTAMYGHLRFLIHPGPSTSKLKGFAQGYILILQAAILAGYLASG